MTHKITFTAPDGTKLTRTTARTYTHAILCLRDGAWRIGSCVGRPELVPDRLEIWGRGSPDVIAVEADKE